MCSKMVNEVESFMGNPKYRGYPRAYKNTMKILNLKIGDLFTCEASPHSPVFMKIQNNSKNLELEWSVCIKESEEWRRGSIRFFPRWNIVYPYTGDVVISKPVITFADVEVGQRFIIPAFHTKTSYLKICGDSPYNAVNNTTACLTLISAFTVVELIEEFEK